LQRNSFRRLQATAGGALIDQAQALNSTVNSHRVNWQLNALGQAQWRTIGGAAPDLGALELP
jgi:hypothetical protein